MISRIRQSSYVYICVLCWYAFKVKCDRALWPVWYRRRRCLLHFDVNGNPTSEKRRHLSGPSKIDIQCTNLLANYKQPPPIRCGLAQRAVRFRKKKGAGYPKCNRKSDILQWGRLECGSLNGILSLVQKKPASDFEPCVMFVLMWLTDPPDTNEIKKARRLKHRIGSKGQWMRRGAWLRYFYISQGSRESSSLANQR